MGVCLYLLFYLCCNVGSVLVYNPSRKWTHQPCHDWSVADVFKDLRKLEKLFWKSKDTLDRPVCLGTLGRNPIGKEVEFICNFCVFYFYLIIYLFFLHNFGAD